MYPLFLAIGNAPRVKRIQMMFYLCTSDGYGHIIEKFVTE